MRSTHVHAVLVARASNIGALISAEIRACSAEHAYINVLQLALLLASATFSGIQLQGHAGSML